MNRTVPRSIRDVGSNTREAAKEAARRAGLSLGEWLDRVISERASERGVSTADMDNQEQLEAVTAELSRLAAASEAAEAAGHNGSAARRQEPTMNVEHGFAERRPVSPAMAAVQRSFGAGPDLSPRVVRARQGRGSVDSRVRGAVNGSLAHVLDTEETDPRSTANAMRALSQRLAIFEQGNWAQPVPDGTLAASRLKADLPSGRGRNGTSAINSDKERFIREAVAEITRRQAALDAEARFKASPDAGNAEQAATHPALRAAGSVKSSGPGSDAAPGPEETSDLDRAVAALEAQLGNERLRTTAPTNPHAEAGEPGKVGHPALPVTDPAGIGSDAELSSRNVGTASQDSPAPEPVASGNRLGELVALRAMEPGGAAGESRAGTERNSTSSEDRIVPQRGERRRKERRSAAQTEQPRVAETIRRQLASIEAAPGQAAAKRPAKASETESTLGQIRALLDGFQPGSTIKSLEQRMEDLAVKIDRGMGPQSSTQIEDLAHRVDKIYSSIRGHEGGPSLEPESVDALARGIAERIEDAREASADIQRLEGLISGLSARIEDGNVLPHHEVVGSLEAQMRRLGDRLERSEASLSALDGVEHSLGELFAQLEETRHAAIDAAENAARTAARDTLRAAMESPQLQHRMGEADAGIAGLVTHELSELRVSHDASSRRTQATLMNLHQTMEKLVEHLARVEAGERPGLAAWQLSDPSAEASKIDAGEGERKTGSAPSVRAELGAQDRVRPGDETRRSAEAIDPIDTLIEPGAGRAPVREKNAKPDVGSRTAPGLASVALPLGEGEGPTSFIAAARRAAHAAQASAAQKAGGRVRVSVEPPSTAALSALERARDFLVERRRPILLSLAGLVLLLGALEVAKLGFSASETREKTGAVETVQPSTVQAALPNSVSGSQVVATDIASAGDRRDAKADAAAPNGSSTARPATQASGGTDRASSVGTIKSAAVSRNTNPFLAGSNLGRSGLPEGLRNLALSGNAAAQYEIGLRYIEGRTVDRDPKVAAAWFEKAAEQGLAPAQYRLGSAYEKGVGQTRDPALAMTWYGRAAEAGNARAMHNFAVMAAEGSVGKPDYAKAANWFQKAATLGVRDSQFNLAVLYARGLGIEQNLGQAYTWFAVAAAQGDDDAAKKRDEVGARLDAKTLASAKAAAESFHPATAVSVANEVAPPPGGWEAVAPSPSGPAATKGAPPKVSIM